MSCMFKIIEGMNSFTNMEKKLAEYILGNKDEVVTLSAQELASKANISAAGVVRFSKALGYKGFTALKVELAKESALENEDVGVMIEPSDSIDIIVKKIGKSNINTIEKTVNLVEKNAMCEAIEAIRNAKNIYLFGIGASGLVAMDLQYKLLRINKHVLYNSDSHVQLTSAVHIAKGDVAIGISYSGETKEVNIAINRAKENGAKTIAVTKYNKNTLSRNSDIILYIPNEEKELRLGAISSRIAALTLMDMIFLGIAKNEFNKTENYLIETRKIINKVRDND